jgi:hypothetical protein
VHVKKTVLDICVKLDGNVIDCKVIQPSNTLFSILVIVSGKVIDCKLVQPINAIVLIMVIVSGNVIDCKLVQFEKQSSGMLVIIVLFNVMFVRFEHDEKQPFSSVSTLFDTIKLIKLLTVENAYLPISETLDGISYVLIGFPAG